LRAARLRRREWLRTRGKDHARRDDQKRYRHPNLKLNAKDSESLDEDMQGRFPLHHSKM